MSWAELEVEAIAEPGDKRAVSARLIGEEARNWAEACAVNDHGGGLQAVAAASLSRLCAVQTRLHPLSRDLLLAAQEELTESSRRLDLAEDRFDDLFL